MSSDVCHDFERNASSFGDRTACLDGGTRLTHRELLRDVETFSARLIDRGMAPGDRVCFLLENSLRFVIVYLAILRGGGVIVPLNPEAPVPALLGQVTDADPAFILFESRRAAEMQAAFGRGQEVEEMRLPASGEPVCLLRTGASSRPVSRPGAKPARGGDTLAAILYTSGTTGKPKGVMLSHGNLSAIAEAGQKFVALRENDCVGAVTPLFHLYGMREIDACIRAGATLVIVRNRVLPTRALEELHAARVTGLSAVPGGMAIFADRYLSLLGRCQPHLRYVTLGAAATSPALLRSLRSTLPGARILVTYGMTENSRVCYRDVTGESEYSGSVGRPYPGVQIRVADEKGRAVAPGVRGRVMLKSAMLMQGYWKQPDLTKEMFAAGGFLKAPDYGWLDDDGALFLAGRTDNLINSGGEKIAPGEVEAVLLRHPAVADVVVTGHPDPNGLVDEVVKAYVVLRQNERVDAESVKSYCSRHLESAKVPRIVEFCAELPKTVLGKTATGQLAQDHPRG